MVSEDNKKYRHLHSTLTMPEANDRSRLPFFTTFVVIEVSEIYCSTKKLLGDRTCAAHNLLGVVSKTEEKCVNSKFTTCSFFSKQMVYIIRLIDLKMYLCTLWYVRHFSHGSQLGGLGSEVPFT